MRISDWSSDVCSSDLVGRALDPLCAGERAHTAVAQARIARDPAVENARIARASLAAWWGGGPDFRLDARTFFQAADMAPVGEDIVDLGLLDAELPAAEARITPTVAHGANDPSVRAGIRHFGQRNEVDPGVRP